jgi:hypothetical protein
MQAISVTSVDGQQFSIGDADTQFCIQSCSKPISYLLAINQFGDEYVCRIPLRHLFPVCRTSIDRVGHLAAFSALDTLQRLCFSITISTTPPLLL